MDHIVHNNGTLTTIGQCMKDTVVKAVTDFLALFYILSPTETTKDDAYDVPDYEVALLPVVGSLVIIEAILRYFQGKDMFRFTDVVINSGSAILFTLMRVFLLTASIVILYWIHNNFALVNLPLHSFWTWIASLLLVEFTYYWVHRALHEFNILWAAHQFHHMAEDVNITTTIRDSVVDLFIYAMFPLPLALVIPPPILLVHVQFSLIYQIWLHNSVIGNLGFIEYVINTPRQHRVHHGKNPYCIDKNYGALIMIWDRMFGTHQTEKEKIVFGVVSPTPQTFDSMTLQFGYYRDVWQKFQKVEGFGNKMSALFKGPGWSPGKPRLGSISDVPEPDPNAPKYSYNPYIPDWKKWYIGVHSIIIILGFYLLADHPYIKFSPGKGMVAILYIIFVLTSFGTIFDDRKYAPIMEIVRCLTYFPFDYFLIARVDWKLGETMSLLLDIFIWSIRILHILSIMFWLLYCAVSRLSDTGSNDTDYAIVSKGNKDVESETSSMRKQNAYKAFFLIFALMLAAIPFLIAMMSKLDSCHDMFNQFHF